ncbi:hypothetical protein QEH59_05740 [Coraliomargarita sp. SDUM461004]|uniref:Glycosyl hydrolase family 71 n=1 Tax=Thalassobacterium sedimentorum TaxID=3041258 RepID=A0ABU1AGF4_9BACT|nr:hypothetical protein [Coraliomargarita sp. SDUM461004]MDQ8193916.1 hypothetical protein [Coraliomargarita sp. SDUM461004]
MKHLRLTSLLSAGLSIFSLWLSGCSPEDSPQSNFIPSSGWNVGDGGPVLAAHYMPWFNNPKTSARGRDEWSHWEWRGQSIVRDPRQLRADGLRDIASVQYPLIGPYSSDNRAVVRYHLETAHAIGIHAFFVIWYGPGSDVDGLLPLILDEAQRIGMKVAICYEEKLNWEPYRHPKSRAEIVRTAIKDLSYVLGEYAMHPAYLRRNGDPFIFQFNFWGSDTMGPRNILPTEWSQIFDALPHPVVYARQNLNPEYHPGIAANYVWWTQDVTYLEDFADYSRSMVDSGQLDFFMNMIAPGFDDSGVDGWGHGTRALPREGLSTLRDTFERSARGAPEVIQLVTWNDFNEGTALEPTVSDGFQYLDALETWFGEHSGRAVNLDDNREPLHRYLKSASAQQLAEVPTAAELIAAQPSDLSVSTPNYLETLDRNKKL